jgi:hypothetical protein
MKSTLAAMLAAGLIPAAARADDAPAAPPPPSSAAATRSSGTIVVASAPGGGWWLADLFVNLFAIGVHAAALHNEMHEHEVLVEDSWGGAVERGERVEQSAGRNGGYRAYRPKHDARQGFLFSIGVGGGQLRVSGADPGGGIGRTGAVNVGLRMGYGFSDRFQLFGDFTADVGKFGVDRDVTNWVLSLRGQTVLVGDREGNGLNVNVGAGVGGTSITYRGAPGFETSSPAALALVGGLSYDARVGRQFSISPELYVTWHPVPNGPGYASDNASTVGVRLNFLWYAP